MIYQNDKKAGLFKRFFLVKSTRMRHEVTSECAPKVDVLQ